MTTPTSTDYTGRTVDLEAMQTVMAPATSRRLELTSTSGDTSRRITGIQKLAQRYAILFLTLNGSVRFRPTQGAEFVGVVAAGRIQDRNSLLGYFVSADADVKQQLADEVTEDDPDDEVLASSELIDYDVSPGTGRLWLRVNLTSRAGDSYTFFIPAS